MKRFIVTVYLSGFKSFLIDSREFDGLIVALTTEKHVRGSDEGHVFARLVFQVDYV